MGRPIYGELYREGYGEGRERAGICRPSVAIRAFTPFQNGVTLSVSSGGQRSAALVLCAEGVRPRWLVRMCGVCALLAS